MARRWVQGYAIDILDKNLPKSTDARRHHRSPAGGGFDGNQSQAFTSRRYDNAIYGSEEAGQVPRRDRRADKNPIVGGLMSRSDDQSRPAGTEHAVDEDVDALVWIGRTDEQGNAPLG